MESAAITKHGKPWGTVIGKEKQLTAAKTPQDQTMLQRQIDARDRQIDRLVYELYDLTDSESQIVEGAKPRMLVIASQWGIRSAKIFMDL